MVLQEKLKILVRRSVQNGPSRLNYLAVVAITINLAEASRVSFVNVAVLAKLPLFAAELTAAVIFASGMLYAGVTWLRTAWTAEPRPPLYATTLLCWAIALVLSFTAQFPDGGIFGYYLSFAFAFALVAMWLKPIDATQLAQAIRVWAITSLVILVAGIAVQLGGGLSSGVVLSVRHSGNLPFLDFVDVRFTGPFWAPGFAAFVAVSILFMSFLFERWIRLAIQASALAIVALTESRVAIFSLGLSAMAVLLMRAHRDRRPLHFLAMAAGLGLLLSTLIFMWLALRAESTGNGRLYLGLQALSVVRESPLIGTSFWSRDPSIPLFLHSSYLLILVTIGILGAIPLTVIAVVSVRRGWSLTNKQIFWPIGYLSFLLFHGVGEATWIPVFLSPLTLPVFLFTTLLALTQSSSNSDPRVTGLTNTKGSSGARELHS